MKKNQAVAFLLSILFYASLLPWSFSPANAENFSYNVKNVTGDNTGRIKDIAIGSASYTDNGAFGDLITKGPWVDVRSFLPAGYVTDGSVDYSTQVQAALDNMTSGSTLLIPITIGLGHTRGGEGKERRTTKELSYLGAVPVGYWDGILIDQKNKITIKGINGGGFRYLASPYFHNKVIVITDGFRIMDSSWVRIEGIHFDMGGFNSAAMMMDNVSFSNITENYIFHHAYDTGTSALMSTGGTYNNYSNNIFDNVSGGLGVGTGVQGYHEIGATISANRFLGANRSAIIGVLATSTIVGNTFDRCNVPINMGANLTDNSYSRDVSVIGNVARNCLVGSNGSYDYAFRTDGGANSSGLIRGVTYVGNTIDNCGGGIAHSNTAEVTVIGNIFRNLFSSSGVSMGHQGKQITIGNIFTGTPANGSSAIFIQGSAQSEGYGHIVAYNQIYGFDNVTGQGAIATANTASPVLSDIIISGNISRGNRYGVWLGDVDNVLISNNILKGGWNNQGVRSDTATPTAWFSNNLLDSIVMGANTSLAPTLVPRIDSAYGGKVGMGKVAYSNAAPSVGVWGVGDIVYNYASDNVLGWKCTTGDPCTTWKSMTITLQP